MTQRTALIHSSTHTLVSTNASPSGRRRVTLRISRIDVRWIAGEVVVRFDGRDADVTASAGREPARPDERGAM